MDLSSLLDGGLIFKIVVAILGVLGIAKYFKNRAIQRWAEVAFKVVEEVSRIDEQNGNKLKVDDKINLFDQKFKEIMKRAGWWIITDADSQQAQEIAKAINVIYENSKSLVSATKEDAKSPNQ